MMIMRNKLLLVVAALVGLASCLPESEMMPEVLKMDVTTPYLNALQTEVRVTVQCDLHWKAELEDPSWGTIEVLSENKGSGGSFIVKIKENLAEEERQNTITLKAGKGEISKTFKQSGLAEFFNPRSIELSGTQEATVYFASPFDWTASIPEEADWLNLKTTSGSAGNAEITCSAKDVNENLGDREAVITLTIGEINLEIPVSQAQKDVVRINGDKELSLNYHAQNLSVQTQYNFDYKVKSYANWITLTTTKAPLNEGVETFAIEENTNSESRSGRIVFSGSDAEQVILTIVQDGRDPIIAVTTPGIYGIYGSDYFWGTDGWNQHTNRTAADGTSRYRLLNAGTVSVLEVDGLRFEDEEGGQMNVNVTLRTKDTRRPDQSFDVTLVGHNDNMYWFKASDETYFIISK